MIANKEVGGGIWELYCTKCEKFFPQGTIGMKCPFCGDSND
jgi:rRNA maturation endonuclease Nob1